MAWFLFLDNYLCMLAIFLLIYVLFIKQLYKTSKRKDHKEREHQKLGSKPGQYSNNPSVIEWDQNEITKTQEQDQDCYKDPSQSSSNQVKVKTGQTFWTLVKLQKFRTCSNGRIADL